MTGGGVRHVDDEILVRRACNELTAAEEERVAEHLGRCDDCREVWQAVERVRRAAVGFDPGAGAPVGGRASRPAGRRSVSRRLRWGGLAAATLAASALLWVSWPSAPVPVPAPSPGPVVRSAPDRFPTPLSPAERSRGAVPGFSWQPLAGAGAYTVDLLDARGDLVWSSDRVGESEVPWPSSVEPRAGRYFWRVSAHFEDGEEPSASPLVSFELISE